MTQFNLTEAYEEKARGYFQEVTDDRIKDALISAHERGSPLARLHTTGLCDVKKSGAFKDFQQAVQTQFPDVVAISQSGQSIINLWTEKPSFLGRARAFLIDGY